MKPRTPVLLSLLLAAACAPRPEIVGPRPSRNPIVFESDQAMSTFEHAVRERYEDGDGDLAGGNARLSLNAYFNRQIDLADRDRDGFISDDEALRFAADAP